MGRRVGGGEVELPMPAPRHSAKLASPPAHGGSFMDRVRKGIRKASEAAERWLALEAAHSGQRLALRQMELALPCVVR